MEWTVDNYRMQVYADGVQFIDENSVYYDDFDALFDDLVMSDCVTGNASGSYTFSTWKAAENVLHPLISGDAYYLFDQHDFSPLPNILLNRWQQVDFEGIDVCIRICLVNEQYDEFEDYYNETRNA